MTRGRQGYISRHMTPPCPVTNKVYKRTNSINVGVSVQARWDWAGVGVTVIVNLAQNFKVVLG